MGGNFQKVGNSLDFFISETKHRIFNFSGPLRNFPSFGEIGGSGYGVLSVRSVGRRALEAVPTLRTDKTP